MFFFLGGVGILHIIKSRDGTGYNSLTWETGKMSLICTGQTQSVFCQENIHHEPLLASNPQSSSSKSSRTDSPQLKVAPLHFWTTRFEWLESIAFQCGQMSQPCSTFFDLMLDHATEPGFDLQRRIHFERFAERLFGEEMFQQELGHFFHFLRLDGGEMQSGSVLVAVVDAHDHGVGLRIVHLRPSTCSSADWRRCATCWPTGINWPL